MAREVLSALFDAAARLGLPTMTVTDVARWWIERDNATLGYAADADETAAIETTGEAIEVFAAQSGHVIFDNSTYHLQPGAWTVLTRSHKAGT